MKLKRIFFLLITIVLVAGAIYLAIVITDDSQQRGVVKTKASESFINGTPQPTQGLLAYKTVTTRPSPTSPKGSTPSPTTSSNGPLPTNSYRTTSPSPTASQSLPTSGNRYTTPMTTSGVLPSDKPTDKPQVTLLVTGVAENLGKMLFGGGALVLIAFLL